MIMDKDASRIPAAQSMARLQTAIGPTLALCTEELLYFRATPHVRFSYATSHWHLGAQGRLSFDTYFNGLSIGTWRQVADIQDLSIKIRLTGHAVIHINVLESDSVSRTLQEFELEAASEQTFVIPVLDWAALQHGILYLSIQALAPSTLHGFEFATATAPARHVRLGLCITHFNRQQHIVPAIRRLKHKLLDDPDYADKVALVVVDNSNNLALEDTAGALVLPNVNLGGAGGFARGLMHLHDSGTFTHALFMDDDASCEVEAIKRTLHLLQYAREDKLAVCGAMLRESEPYRQFENGAIFFGLCRALKTGYDLRERSALVANEVRQHIDYGAWWFFAFPLAHARGYPFPYFVRGDDIDFSLRNDFDIVSMNGVGSWQEDFTFKQGPLTNYLDTRNHLLQVLHGLQGGRVTAIYICLRMFLFANLSIHYEAASAATMAVTDVLKGPGFFRDNADMAEPRRRMQDLVKNERMQKVPLKALRDTVRLSHHESSWHTLLRWATLNGHLVPQFLFRQRTALLDKQSAMALRTAFARRTLIAYHAPSGTGLVLNHSKPRFFGNMLRHGAAMLTLLVRYPQLCKAYQRAYPDLTSERYWREKFGPGSGL
jgi:hypothetical protein